jgi:hypothetical protein
MSVHITVAKQTSSYTTKSVKDETVEGYDAAYTPTPPNPIAAPAKARQRDSLDEPKSCVTG